MKESCVEDPQTLFTLLSIIQDGPEGFSVLNNDLIIDSIRHRSSAWIDYRHGGRIAAREGGYFAPALFF